MVLTIGRTGWRKTDPPDAKKPLPPFRLLVRDTKGVERFDTADIVLDCTGTYSKPNWVGDGGTDGEVTGTCSLQYVGASDRTAHAPIDIAEAALVERALHNHQSTHVRWAYAAVRRGVRQRERELDGIAGGH